MNTVERLMQAAVEADDAWSAALKARYGSRAAAARYDHRGKLGPELSALYQRYRDANDAWRRCYTVKLTHNGGFFEAEIFRGLLKVGEGMAHGKIAAVRAAIWSARQRRKNPALFPA